MHSDVQHVTSMTRHYREVRPQANGYCAEDGVLGLRLLLVVRDDVLEGDLAQLVDLAHPVQGAKDHLVQVAAVHHIGLLRDYMRHHCVHLQHDE